ncbi:MAG: excinuclease ABC subunit UvrC [Bacteroidales bacterium]|nr:excinuclease ABC subunit UvrC [Bacteroidales bacterium]MCM1146775.1 excinuclease ABC subunit UvrC [Bacteroidales bacterium]MCM1205728.1 excinuclease ABC subunit UvrC [Bacillota bacterium]MCM1510742.1 excinuclease ABC subunit UvrC [Clostridium sp.]
MKESNEARLTRLKNIVLNMPEKPGSYQYYDAEGTIIYVGKAKNLKRRVSSYFHKEVDRFKTKILVSKIMNITYTVVNTEDDALLLENALIKKYNPRYNILLKDGKTYPSICITNEFFPRIFPTRQINRNSGTYFGPYANVGSMYAVLDFIKKLYHPRTCRMNIQPLDITRGKYKPCLEYHIKNCGGCCIGKQSMKDYQANMQAAREILKGNTRQILTMIWDEMQQAAGEMRFEDAQRLKEKYFLVEQFCAKSEVVSHTVTNVDVFTCLPDDDNGNAYVNFIHVTNGQINQSFTFEYKRRLGETAEEILVEAITEIRERFRSTAREIIVEKQLEWNIPGTEFFVPQRGDKAHLLELSRMNCRQYKVDRLKQSAKLNPEQRATRLMQELRDKLRLPSLPMRIEAFDNSNISGSDAVASCVVFCKMKPSKKDYRKYNIKTVEGPDDYASMQEIVRRRYGKAAEELRAVLDTKERITLEQAKSVETSLSSAPLPDLIVCDGGTGQMHCVAETVWGELMLDIPIAGLAKDDRHRTNELLYLQDIGRNVSQQPVAVQLKTDSELFHVLTQLQDEVHRFAITFHRDKRSKSALASELDNIKGIGPKTADALLKAFKSVKRIKEADYQSIADIIGPAKAKILKEELR